MMVAGWLVILALGVFPARGQDVVRTVVCDGGDSNGNAEGVVTDASRLSSLSSTLLVGDLATDEAVGSILSCHVTGLSDLLITSVSLVLTRDTADDINPSSGTFAVEQASSGSFGSSALLQPDDYIVEAGLPNLAVVQSTTATHVQILLDGDCGLSDADDTRIQFRVRLASGSNSDGEANLMAFFRGFGSASGSAPQLRVEGTVNNCPDDPNKTEPGQCGCGVVDTDSDTDGTADCNDGCPSDPDKTAVGDCGCGTADTDSDSDGTADCNDGCPSDPDKTATGTCGCGTPDTDSDSDGTPNCNDSCPSDAAKTSPGECGCGTADTDSDSDGTPNCNDECPSDPDKTAPGECGCGTADTDSDSDGTPNCDDNCPSDPAKTAPGSCGCGTADTDSDSDGTADCDDSCPSDPAKTVPGSCGCGTPETDSDSDGTTDCNDSCPSDPAKTAPGTCGCGTADTDSDSDGTPNCNDNCPADPSKTSPGECGCGTADTDSDSDGTPNCNDGCPSDPAKTAPGECGCGTADTDSDSDGTPDCDDNCPSDPTKTAVGACGCGTPDTDSDSDGTADCNDNCPSDPEKTAPGTCGCGTADTDSDSDGTLDCNDNCPADPAKTAPGTCGCGSADTDSDSDGTADCDDECPSDPDKASAGECGCGVAEGTCTPQIVSIPCDGGFAQMHDGLVKDGRFSCNVKTGGDALRVGLQTGFVVSCPLPAELATTYGGRAIAAAHLELANGMSSGLSVGSGGVGDVLRLQADLAEAFNGDPNLEPADWDAASDVSGLAPVVSTPSSGTTHLSLDAAALSTAARTLQQWQIRVKPVEASVATASSAGITSQAFMGFYPGTSDPDSSSTPTLRLTFLADQCPSDPNKMVPGECGCGVADVDSDSDGTLDCNDGCPADPDKTAAGDCGCGEADTDSDSDGTADCIDACPSDDSKVVAGVCGCGVADTDTDEDGVADCNDLCDSDPLKIHPGQCGCGNADTDSDGDGTADCQEGVDTRPAVVVLTDLCHPDVDNFAVDEKDRDDVQSLVRFLVHSDLFQVKGLIAQTSWYGLLDTSSYITGVIHPQTIHATIDKYAAAYDNLKVHSSLFPDPEYLHSVVRTGRVSDVTPYWGGNYVNGDIGDGRRSDGSDLIKEVLLATTQDVWFLAWGKIIELGQALYELEQELTTAEFNAVLQYVHVYDIVGQDNVGAWMAHNYDIPMYIRPVNSYKGMSQNGDASLISESWVQTNVKGHSALGTYYPSTEYSHSVVEGDSPSFLYLLSQSTGLSDIYQPSWGSWGGRFYPNPVQNVRRPGTPDTAYKPWYMYGEAPDLGSKSRAIWRWRHEFQAHFQARMDWCKTSSLSGANHQPLPVTVNGSPGPTILYMTAAPGSTFTLAASTTDPDGHSVAYKWWRYEDADTATTSASFSAASSATTDVTLSGSAVAGTTYHFVVEAMDSGTPALMVYRRVVVSVT